MVYVVTLFRIMPCVTRMEVYENRRDALERAAIWSGMNEKVALVTDTHKLEEFVMQNPTCTIQKAEFFPELPTEFSVNSM